MDLRKYAEYRRTELAAERQRLAEQNLSGVSTGALIEFDQKAKVVGLLLAELDLILNWQEAGEPAFLPPLTADERRFWEQARDRGLEIPETVRGQL